MSPETFLMYDTEVGCIPACLTSVQKKHYKYVIQDGLQNYGICNYCVRIENLDICACKNILIILDL